MKMKQFFVFLSLLCAIGVFLMTSAFQSMAYWGNDLTWYWVGVVFTYFIWLMGTAFFFLSINRQRNEKRKLIFNLSILERITLAISICGFLWTTFVIIAGMSGI